MDKYVPKIPSEYSEPQIILNSDRILFNAKKDSIFLFANKSIGLASRGTINFDIENYLIVNSKKNYLGLRSPDETEPAVLGGQLRDFLDDLMDLLEDASQDFKQAEASCEGGKIIMVNMAGRNIEERVKELKKMIPPLFSKITYLE